jgi:hypothetical protein
MLAEGQSSDLLAAADRLNAEVEVAVDKADFALAS